MLDEKEFYRILSEWWREPGQSEGMGPCRNCMLRPAVTFHHIEPRSLAPSRIYDPLNLIPLCNECHEWAEGAGEPGRRRLHGIMATHMVELTGAPDEVPNGEQDE